MTRLTCCLRRTRMTASVVARLVLIQRIARVGDYARRCLGRIFGRIVGFGKLYYIVALPAVVERHAYAGVYRAVAHGDEHVVFTYGEAALVYGLAIHDARSDGVIPVLAIAQHDHVGIVKLNQLHNLIV